MEGSGGLVETGNGGEWRITGDMEWRGVGVTVGMYWCVGFYRKNVLVWGGITGIM